MHGHHWTTRVNSELLCFISSHAQISCQFQIPSCDVTACPLQLYLLLFPHLFVMLCLCMMMMKMIYWVWRPEGWITVHTYIHTYSKRKLGLYVKYTFTQSSL